MPPMLAIPTTAGTGSEVGRSTVIICRANDRKTVVFSHPFRLKGVDRVLPPGHYEVVTDEELIEGLSFPVYHRVSTAIIVPAQSHHASSVEMVPIDPRDLPSAQDRDTAVEPAAEAKPASGRSSDFDEGRSEQGIDGYDRQND